MTAFITGGAGFLGINLVRYLLSRGWHITSFDIAPFEYPERDRVRAISGDIRDLPTLSSAMRGSDVVVHCAAALPSYTADAIMSTEVAGTRHVLQAALEHGIARVVHISSTAVYGIPNAGDSSTCADPVAKSVSASSGHSGTVAIIGGDCPYGEFPSPGNVFMVFSQLRSSWPSIRWPRPASGRSRRRGPGVGPGGGPGRADPRRERGARARRRGRHDRPRVRDEAGPPRDGAPPAPQT